jgi:hypothetical protein
MPYTPINMGNKNPPIVKYNRFNWPVIFYDRVTFMGPDSSIEFLGGKIIGDLMSANWDGGFDLTSLDTDATKGFYLDSDVGSVQFMGNIWLGGDLSIAAGGQIQIAPVGSAFSINIDEDSVSFPMGAVSLAVGGDPWISTVQLGPSPDELAVWHFKGPFHEDATTWPEMKMYSAEDGLAQVELIVQQGTSNDGLRVTNNSDAGVVGYTTVSIPHGSAAHPSLSFYDGSLYTADSDTGIYRYGANVIGFATGGALRMYISTDAIGNNNQTGNFRIKHDAAGSGTAPTYSFEGDQDTGIYRSGTNELSIATAGAQRAVFRSDGNLTGTGTYGGSAGVLMRLSYGGSDHYPTYAFNNDSDTGMFRYAANMVGFAAAGTTRAMVDVNGIHSLIDVLPSVNTWWKQAAEFSMPDGNSTRLLIGTKRVGTGGDHSTSQNILTRIVDVTYFGGLMLSSGESTLYFQATSAGPYTSYGRLSVKSSQVESPLFYSNTTTQGANAYIATNGAMCRSTSALKYKDNVLSAEWLSDVPLRPVGYNAKQDGSLHYGLIADEIAAALPAAGEYGEDGEIENFDTRAVMAVMAAKINRLEKQLTRLEKSGTLPGPNTEE